MNEVLQPSSCEITGFLETMEGATKGRILSLAGELDVIGDSVDADALFKAALGRALLRYKAGNEYEQLCLRLDRLGGVVANYSVGVTELGFSIAVYRYFLMLRDADFANMAEDAKALESEACKLLRQITYYAEKDLIGLLNDLFDFELTIPDWVFKLTM
jgi:hypothetical protein